MREPSPWRYWLLLAILAVVSRSLSVPKWPGDWDEYQFLFGVIDYNLLEHHPHPPGYPVYIMLIKPWAWLLGDAWRGIQAHCFAWSALAPLMVMWAFVPVGSGLVPAFLGALLFTFSPLNWVTSASAFSETTGLVFVYLAIGAYARASRGNRWFAVGAAGSALAIGVRPQMMLPHLIWMAFAALRGASGKLRGAILFALIVSGWLGWQIAATGTTIDGVIWSMKDRFQNFEATDLTHTHDFMAELGWRLPLRGITDAGFLGTPGFLIMAALGILGLASRRWSAMGLLWCASGVVAVCQAAYMMDFTLTRYFILGVPAMTCLAGEGLFWLGGRRPPGSRIAAGMAVLALVCGFAYRTYPIVRVIHHDDRPFGFVAAKIAPGLDASRDVLLYDPGVRPQVELAFPAFRRVCLDLIQSIETIPHAGRVVFIGIDENCDPPGSYLASRSWADIPLMWRIVRRRERQSCARDLEGWDFNQIRVAVQGTGRPFPGDWQLRTGDSPCALVCGAAELELARAENIVAVQWNLADDSHGPVRLLLFRDGDLLQPVQEEPSGEGLRWTRWVGRIGTGTPHQRVLLMETDPPDVEIEVIQVIGW